MKLKLNGLIPQHVVKLREDDHKEPEQPPFPAEFHEFMHNQKQQFPGSDAHKIMRETLKGIGVDKGVDAAVDYVIDQFPQYEKYRKELTKYLTMDNIDKKVKFEE